ncbi:MAG TPA: hypothetical protein O0X27_05650 [Methanocorpusculum sp.]|nr:hypothetical protein [Methanocorpusculum sp.]
MNEELMRTQVRQTQDRRLLKAYLRMIRTMLANHARAVDDELRGYRIRQDDLRIALIRLTNRVNQLEKRDRK